MGRDHTFYDSEFENEYFDENDDGSFTPNKVFLAMSFDEEMTEYFYSIREETKRLGLKLLRVDESVGSGFVLKKITNGIEDSEFLIFDLTNERPNVYYELGYAHGVGNQSEEILLIAKNGTNIHFDVAPLKIVYYDSPEDLRSKVYLNLKKMIEITRE